ncbi:hypothetical protein GCM10009693_26480 [Leucobacter chromiireducens subsp. chromiireducens]
MLAGFTAKRACGTNEKVSKSCGFNMLLEFTQQRREVRGQRWILSGSVGLVYDAHRADWDRLHATRIRFELNNGYDSARNACEEELLLGAKIRVDVWLRHARTGCDAPGRRAVETKEAELDESGLL